jgi:hypothetical protein
VEVLARHLERRHRLSPQAAEAVAQRADGNPLFARYLVEQSWTPSQAEAETIPVSEAGASGLPAALRALLESGLRERLSRVDDRSGCAATLQDVAVLGAQVDVSLLSAVSGVPEATLKLMAQFH